MAENPVFFHSGGLRDFPHQSAGALRVPVHRHHVSLRIVGNAAAQLPVEMYRHVRNQYGVPVQVHQAGGNAVSFPHCQPSGYGKRPVQPGAHDHTAVLLNVQPHIVL